LGEANPQDDAQQLPSGILMFDAVDGKQQCSIRGGDIGNLFAS